MIQHFLGLDNLNWRKLEGRLPLVNRTYPFIIVSRVKNGESIRPESTEISAVLKLEIEVYVCYLEWLKNSSLIWIRYPSEFIVLSSETKASSNMS